MSPLVFFLILTQAAVTVLFVLLWSEPDCGALIHLWLVCVLVCFALHLFCLRYLKLRNQIIGSIEGDEFSVLVAKVHAILATIISWVASMTGWIMAFLSWRNQPECVAGPQASQLFALLVLECGIVTVVFTSNFWEIPERCAERRHRHSATQENSELDITPATADPSVTIEPVEELANQPWQPTPAIHPPTNSSRQ